MSTKAKRPYFLSIIHRRKSKGRSQINRLSALICPNQAPPLLTLPREIRDMIYAYLLPTTSRLPIQPAASIGFTSISTSAPPLSLQLTCRQLRAELMDAFYSTAIFEVGNLNPHARRWRSDPEYTLLAASPHLPHVRHLKVRIGLDRASMRSSIHHSLQWFELPPKHCVNLVCVRASMLGNVLQTHAENLRTVTVDWWDDFGFGEEVDRKRVFKVLQRIEGLEGVKWKVGNVQALKKVSEDVKRAVEQGVKELNDGIVGAKGTPG